MKNKIFLVCIIGALILGSCSRGLTPYEAASGKQKCGRGYIK